MKKVQKQVYVFFNNYKYYLLRNLFNLMYIMKYRLVLLFIKNYLILFIY